jgi:hypothetical protein
MSDTVRELTLVDSERFNKLISTLQQSLERKNIVEQATSSAREQDYVQSYHDVTKSVKNKSALAGMDIVNFLNKKDKLQNSQKASDIQIPKPPADDNAVGNATPGRRRPQRPGTTVEGAKEKIVEIFKTQGVTRAGNGNVTHKGTRYNVPYEDLVYDLSHNTTKKTANLTSIEAKEGMQLLKKINMPASSIRNTRLRADYISTRVGGIRILPDLPTSSSDEMPTTSMTTPRRRSSSIPRPAPRTALGAYNRRPRSANYTPYQRLDKDIRRVLQ